MHRSLTVIAVALCAACSPTRHEDPPVSAPPPAREVSAILDGRVVRVTWAPPPTGRVDGYAVDARAEGDADWWRINGELIPPEQHAAELVFVEYAPEHLLFGFRVRTYRDGISSLSGEAWLRSPVYPPTELTAAVRTDAEGTRTGPIDVRWRRISRVATAVRLERRAIDLDGLPGMWTELPVAPGATAYVDPDVAELTVYEYRVMDGVDGNWSVPAEARTERTDLRAPADVVVSVVDGALQAAWSPQPLASSFIIEKCRTTCSPIATVAAGATSARVELVPWPTDRVRVRAVRTDGAGILVSSAPSPPLALPPFRLGAAPVAFDASARAIPRADHAVLDGAGRVHALRGPTDLEPAVLRPAEDGWEPFALPDLRQTATPALLVDAEDHPHVVYVPRDAPRIVHVWHDGSAWHSEEIPGARVADAGLRTLFAGVAADGTVHVVYTREPVDPFLLSVAHAMRTTSGWTEETIAEGTLFGARGLSVPPDGAAIALGSFGLLARDPADGTWSALGAPGIPATAFAAANGGRAIAVGWGTQLDGGTRIDWAALGPDGWSAAERALTLPPSSYSPDFLVGISADGGRSHVVAQWAADGVPGSLRLSARDDAGWAEVLLASEQPYGRFSTGYRNGKRWVLTWSQESADACIASVYVEP